MTRREIQKDITSNIKKGEDCIFYCSPRVGKTRIIIDVIKRDKPQSILWVTPFSNLKEAVRSEFDKWSAKRYQKKLSVETYHILSKIEGHYDLIIFDECQKVTENNVENLFSGSLTYDQVILMTGTKSEDFTKQIIYKKLGVKLVYDYGIDEAIKDEVVSDFNLTIHLVPMSTKKTLVKKKKEGGTFKVSEASDYQWLDKMANQAIYQGRADINWRINNRRRAIYDSPSKEEVADNLLKTLPGKKLIFASSIDQAERFSDCNYHSKNKNQENIDRFNDGKVDILSLVNTGSIGSTYKAIDHCILVQIDRNKNGNTVQKVFRSLLKQKNYKANIHFIILRNTQDEKWLKMCLKKLGSITPKYEYY